MKKFTKETQVFKIRTVNFSVPFGAFEPGGAADEVTTGPTDEVVTGIEVGVPPPVGVAIFLNNIYLCMYCHRIL